MSKQETDPQDNAFPQENNFTMEFGLTKREYFAAMAPDHIFKEKHTIGDIGKALGKPDYRLTQKDFMMFDALLAVEWSYALIKALNEKEG